MNNLADQLAAIDADLAELEAINAELAELKAKIGPPVRRDSLTEEQQAARSALIHRRNELWARRDVLEDNKRHALEVPVRISASRSGVYALTVTCCPYCGERHTYGGGSTDGPVNLGHRWAKCVGKSPTPGCILVEAAK